MAFAIVDKFALFSECRNYLSESQAIFVGIERLDSEKLSHNIGYMGFTCLPDASHI